MNDLWIVENFSNIQESLKFLRTIKIPVNHQNILQLKINIEQDFEEPSSNDLKKLRKKFKNTSILILIAASNDSKFVIYWKSKDISKILRLKSYKDNFFENDKCVYNFIVDFLEGELQKGHLGINKNIWNNSEEIELHSLADHRNYNLLLLACESGHIEHIEILLLYGLESQLPENDITAQNLALKNQHFEILLKLLEANFKFPESIDKNQCPEGINKFIVASEEFHEAIKANNLQKLQFFLEIYPKLRHFYNFSNESAMKVAVDYKQMKVYELLVAKNLSFGPHEDTDKIWNSLTITDREDLHDIHIKYLKDMPEKHINILMANTSFSHDEIDEENRRSLVFRAYQTLNDDPRIKIILKVVAATKIFHIVFDFYRDSTYRIDPTTSAGTTGTFYFTGRVLIGAKQLLSPETQHETFGTLAHELCHYAVYVIFENKANPYPAHDKDAQKNFQNILDICAQNKDKEEVIKNVYEFYRKSEQPSELIVRPAHLIALYRQDPEKLKEISEIFQDLFDYYEKIVIPAMEKALPDIETRLAYKPAYIYNKLTDEKKIKVQNGMVSYKNIKVKLCELFSGDFKIYDKLTSDHISQLLNNKVLNFKDSQMRYLEELIDFKWENLTEKIKQKCLNSYLNFQGQNVKFKDLNESCSAAFHTLTSQQIISILSGHKFIIGSKVESDIEFYLERKFINEDAKLFAFEYEHGHDYEVDYKTEDEHVRNRIKDQNFQEFSDKFFQNNFDFCTIIFDKVKKNEFFQTRHYDLTLTGFNFMHKNSHEVISHAENEKLFILSSEAGAGKTATFEQLAMDIKNKCRRLWVSYVDLKDYTEHYKRAGTAENVEKLLEDILNLDSSKNEFERKIFEEFFKSGKIVIFWNGFDEISPTYNEFIFNIIHWIYSNTNNVQYVCTRPLYSDQLSKGFKIRSWQLVPLSFDDKNEFLKRCFEFHQVSSDKIDEFIEKVNEIIQKLNYDVNAFAYNFNTPLMLKLLAEVHEDENLFKLGHVYGIFETFIEKKIGMWLEKSTRSHNIAKKLIISGSLRMIFQRYALLDELHVFSSTTLTLKIKKLQIMQKKIMQDLPFEEISRMGLLYINGKNKFEFAHRTFAEFFIAQYFIEAIYSVDDDVNSDEAELRLEIFFHFAKSYGHTQKIVTDFMASYLEMNKDIEAEHFNPNISTLLRTKFKNFFLRLLDTNYPDIFVFLFDFFKKDPYLLADLLHVNQDETFYTAIFNPNHFSLFTNPEGIKELAVNYLNAENFDKFVNGRNQKGVILFGLHFYGQLEIPKIHNSYELIINELKISSFNDIFQLLNIKEQKELFKTAVNPKIYLFYDKYFNPSDFPEYEKLWIDYEHLLTVDELQELLGDSIIYYFEVFPNDKAGHELFLSLLLQKSTKFLSSLQIFQMFLNKNILHEAHWHNMSFTMLWCFLSCHTSKQDRKQILLQDDFGDKNFYFWSGTDDMKNYVSINEYSYFNYDFIAFKVLHRSMILPSALTFDFIQSIYQIHFNRKELQDIILSSNDFIYYAIGKAKEEPCRKFVDFLEGLFKGNEDLLKELLERKVKRTNLSVLEYVEDVRGLAHYGQDWFANLQLFTDLYDRITASDTISHD
ncbi:uncharacterized protein [Chironomus tepperi]|uniref:uncharacterized protein n=1 Tax=Chironomus tepperi TaxID=113505 RepID=UPI00391F3F8D